MDRQSRPTRPAQAQATAHSTRLMLVTLLALLVTVHAAESPHTPLNITWQIIDASSGTILNQTSQTHPRDTWFPELRFDLLSLFPTGCPSGLCLEKERHFYVCPGHSQKPKDPCGSAADYFCASWSCVSTGHIWWTPPKSGDLITVKRPPTPPHSSWRLPLSPVSISFTEQGKKAASWETGKTWGIRLYDKSRLRVQGLDPGGLFTIRMQATPPVLQSSTGIGPNQVLAPQHNPAQVAPPKNTQAPTSRPPASPTHTRALPVSPAPSCDFPSDTDPL